MSDNQKYGVLTIICSFLLMLLTLTLSEGWSPRADYIYNILNLLDVRLVLIRSTSGDFGAYYLIDVQTKYVLLTFLSVGAYGFTTYLGITPAFRPWTYDWLKGAEQKEE